MNLARVNDEAIAKEWTEVYAKPGPTAHEMFVRGAFASDLEPYVELVVRAGSATRAPFGASRRSTCATSTSRSAARCFPSWRRRSRTA